MVLIVHLGFTLKPFLFSLPKLPFIVKARFVSAKAESVFPLCPSERLLTLIALLRAKIKEAGGVVSLIA